MIISILLKYEIIDKKHSKREFLKTLILAYQRNPNTNITYIHYGETICLNVFLKSQKMKIVGNLAVQVAAGFLPRAMNLKDSKSVFCKLRENNCQAKCLHFRRLVPISQEKTATVRVRKSLTVLIKTIKSSQSFINVSPCRSSGVQWFQGRTMLGIGSSEDLELSSNFCFLCKAQWYLPDSP